jgi:hypothetical protein
MNNFTGIISFHVNDIASIKFFAVVAVVPGLLNVFNANSNNGRGELILQLQLFPAV